MPRCKNDPRRSYVGTEPSPKGLGYCAHAEAVGKIRKGVNGLKWIVRQDPGGRKVWRKLTRARVSANYNPEQHARQTLEKRLRRKWQVLAEGNFYVVTRDRITLVKSSKKTPSAKNKELVAHMKAAQADRNVKALLMSGASYDNFHHFVFGQWMRASTVKQLLEQDDPWTYILQHYRRFFEDLGDKQFFFK